MSYCVNCGVELDDTAQACALCNTPVINPNILKKSKAELEKNRMKPPYPVEASEVEDVKRVDMIILLTVVFGSTALICLLLNLFVFNSSRWSLSVIGACAILWVIFVPYLIYRKMSPFFAILLDGLIVAVYLYILTFMVDTARWFWGMGLPIVVLTTLVIECFVFCVRKLPRSILTLGLYFFSAVSVLILGLEIIIDLYLTGSIRLSWSMLVFTICLIVDITIITLLSRRGLRDAVRRRLHF